MLSPYIALKNRKDMSGDIVQVSTILLWNKVFCLNNLCVIFPGGFKRVEFLKMDNQNGLYFDWKEIKQR